MRFYKKHHQFYIRIDLHARTMYICIFFRITIDNMGPYMCYTSTACFFAIEICSFSGILIKKIHAVLIHAYSFFF